MTWLVSTTLETFVSNQSNRQHSKHSYNFELCLFINPVTGVWPSEETLAYYCLKHRGIFHHKTVLEVGGGMTCLAALTVTLSSNPASVCCTDGNPASVDNIERILNHNKFDMQSITCQQVLFTLKSYFSITLKTIKPEHPPLNFNQGARLEGRLCHDSFAKQVGCHSVC